jgi:general stress protein 26
MLNISQAQELWSKIKGIKVGMMASFDGDGIRARPMSNVQKDFDGKLWFYTAKSSAKSCALQQDDHVCVTYEDRDRDIFVSVSGRAQIIQNAELISKFWNPFVSAWFPEGKNDPEVALIEIEVQKAEYWDSDQNSMTVLYEVAKANLTGQRPDLGENRKLN